MRTLFDLRTTALTAATLQLCGCIFLYEEAPSGGGASGSGGAGGTSTTATGGGVAQGGAGGESGQGGSSECNDDATHCGPSGKDCEGGDCRCGVCQGVEIELGASNVTGPVGFGGSTFAYLSGANMCFLNEAGAGTEPACVERVPNTDALGTHVAVSSDGEAFYSAQNSPVGFPFQRCSPSGCELEQGANVVAGHLNGLTIAFRGTASETLLGVDPGSAKLFRLNLDNSAFTEELTFLAMLQTPLVLHDLAQHGDLFVASNQQGDATNPPCLSVLQGAELGQISDGQATNQSSPCTAKPVQADEQILGVAIGPDQNIYARARVKTQQGGAEMETLRMNAHGEDVTGFGPPAPENPGSYSDAIASDGQYVYFFAKPKDALSEQLFRCDPIPGPPDCRPMSAGVSGTGSIAVGGKYVYYTDGTALFRAVRP